MSDLISRQAAIDALKNDMASLDHIIKGMSANDVRLDAYVSQRNQVNYDIYTINNIPPALDTNLAEVGTDCISRQAAIDALDEIEAEVADGYGYQYAKWREYFVEMPSAQPDIIRCRNCKFASGDSRICMKFGHSPIGELDFCAWAERRTDE